jgi:hypothetical protein
MFYVLMIVSGLSLPMPDMATCEEAAFFLRYNYYKRPICDAIQDTNSVRVDTAVKANWPDKGRHLSRLR